MILATVIALAQLSAPAALPAFQPIEGAVYRCDTSETRSDGGGSQRFHAARHIVFHREGGGYLAETTIDAAEQSGPQAGSAFLAGNRAFLGRTIRVHLDSAGTLIAVDDTDALIDRMAASVAAAVRGVAGPARAAAIGASLRSLDAGQRRAMLGSAVADLIRPADVARPDGTRAVTLPAQAPLPPSATLSGTETVRRDGAVIAIATHAAGPVTVGGGAVPGSATGTITVDLLRQVDPASALVLEQRATRTIATANGAGSSRAETVTTLTLDPKTP